MKRSEFEAWCLTSYSEAFSAWIHILAVRLFVESILRYGLPPQFLPVLMRPNPKAVAKLRKVGGELDLSRRCGRDALRGEGLGAETRVVHQECTWGMCLWRAA